MNGKRVLLVLLSMMLFSIGASAQMVKASFGVTGGGIATQMHTEPATSAPLYISGYGGLFSTVNFGELLGARVGMNYAKQGGKYAIESVNISVDQSYINIPISVLVNLKSFITVEAGLYQNILLNSSYNENGGDNVTISPDDGALAYNFGALAGVSFNLGKFVFLSMKYNYGLSKSYVIHGKGYPSSAITVGLGFNIISTRKKAF